MKTGGRKMGSINKRTEALAAAVRDTAKQIEAVTAGAFCGDGHAYLMTIYKDPAQPTAIRIDAAKAAIGYEKPRLAAVEHTGDPDQPLAFQIISGVMRHGDEASEEPA
jgi:hypothetical protein